MMDAPRPYLRTLLEWMVAAAITATAVLVGSLMFDEVRSIQASIPLVAEEEPAIETPAGVPPGAVAVPLLLLPDGTTIRVGDRAASMKRQLGEGAHLMAETVERGPSSERIVQIYVHANTQFVLVIEPAGNTLSRIVAIYVK